MRDGRIMLLRKALDALLDSLDATVRVQRWTGEETIPEPLTESAGMLLLRLGAADRLLARKFSGAPDDSIRMDAMTVAIKRLDGAYVEYRKRITERPAERDTATVALDTAVTDVKATASRW
jgi:hypothetical protein